MQKLPRFISSYLPQRVITGADVDLDSPSDLVQICEYLEKLHPCHTFVQIVPGANPSYIMRIKQAFEEHWVDKVLRYMLDDIKLHMPSFVYLDKETHDIINAAKEDPYDLQNIENLLHFIERADKKLHDLLKAKYKI